MRSDYQYKCENFWLARTFILTIVLSVYIFFLYFAALCTSCTTYHLLLRQQFLLLLIIILISPATVRNKKAIVI